MQAFCILKVPGSDSKVTSYQRFSGFQYGTPGAYPDRSIDHTITASSQSFLIHDIQYNIQGWSIHVNHVNLVKTLKNVK
jgi:hypothetical protein